MPRVPLIDRLLLWLFGFARSLFFLQGLAFGCAAAATVAFTSASASPWTTRVFLVTALISVTLVGTGLALSWMRSWLPTPDRSEPAESVWPTALAGSLVLIAGLTVAASALLPGLWRQILAQLSAIDFWQGLSTPSQFGGIILLPILLALSVPLLVAAAAVFSFFFPLVMLARLPSRPLMFPTLVSMGAACHGALVATSWLATRLVSDLSQVAAATMSKAPDQDVRQLADQMTAAVGTLSITTTMLMLPLAALVGWAVFLRPSGSAAAQFGREPVASKPLNLEGSLKEETFAAFSADAAETMPPARALPLAYGGLALIGLGVLMLLFTAMNSARSRAAYVTSTPAAGASVSATPSAIRVTFNGALHPASTLSLVYVPVVPSIDDISRDISVSSRLASADAERRTIEVIPPRLATGVYLVRWVANPERGGVIVHGSFAFGVGVAVPPDSDGVTYSLHERDSGARGHRLTMLGGVLLLAMGALTWYRSSLVQ